MSDRKIPVKDVSNTSLIAYYEADIQRAVDYYPFGREMNGRIFYKDASEFGYNGKQNIAEWSVRLGGAQLYGFRIKYGEGFLSVDPLFQSYPFYTPFQFAGNKPIAAIDLDGLEESIEIRQRQKDLALLGITNEEAAKAQAEVARIALTKAATFTDVNDATVLTTTFTRGSSKAINIDGTPADNLDIAAATFGAFIPFVSGSAIIKASKAFAKTSTDLLGFGTKFLTKEVFENLPKVGKIDPKTIRFSQDNIKKTFQEGGSIEDMTKALKEGKLKAEDVPPIKIVEKDGKIYSLDNRRLKAFQDAGVDIHYEKVKLEDLSKNDMKKFSTENEGTSVEIRK